MKKKMLVVDDEPGVLDMIRGHFKHHGFDVVTAEDGDEGVKLCREHKPDVILLDFKMKHMDGDEAVPHLRETVPKALILMVSAYQDEAAKKRLRGLGIDGYFEKPVSILELQRVIENALNLSK